MFGMLRFFIFIGILIFPIISDHATTPRCKGSCEVSDEDSDEKEDTSRKQLEGKVTNLQDTLARLLKAMESTTSTYIATTPLPPTPPPPPQYHERQYMGCYTDGVNRAMMNFNLPRHTNTIDSCLNNCKSRGFKFSGTAYYYECYCSTNLPNPATHPRCAESRCNTRCRGNRHQICGGGFALSIYATGKN